MKEAAVIALARAAWSQIVKPISLSWWRQAYRRAKKRVYHRSVLLLPIIFLASGCSIADPAFIRLTETLHPEWVEDDSSSTNIPGDTSP